MREEKRIKKTCRICGQVFYTKYNVQVLCSEACRKKSIEITQEKHREKQKRLNKLKNFQQAKKTHLSIDDVLKIGHKYNIYSYGKIVQKIENGEIEVD